MGRFQRCTGLWTAGCWLARRLHQLKASTTIMDLDISIFFVSVWCVIQRNLGLLIKSGWSVIYPLCCREHWPWVGDKNRRRMSLLGALLTLVVFSFFFFFLSFRRIRMAQQTSTSIHLYTPRPYISQRSLLTHTHKTKPESPTQQSLSLHPTR